MKSSLFKGALEVSFASFNGVRMWLHHVPLAVVLKFCFALRVFPFYDPHRNNILVLRNTPLIDCAGPVGHLVVVDVEDDEDHHVQLLFHFTCGRVFCLCVRGLCEEAEDDHDDRNEECTGVHVGRRFGFILYTRNNG